MTYVVSSLWMKHGLVDVVRFRLVRRLAPYNYLFPNKTTWLAGDIFDTNKDLIAETNANFTE